MRPSEVTQSPAALRGVAGLAFLGAGISTILGSIERWWPICRPDAIETTKCVDKVSHLYDELPPLWVWDPSATVAAYNTGAALLTALGLVLVALLAAPRRRPTTYAIGGLILVTYPIALWFGTTDWARSPVLLVAPAYCGWGFAAPYFLYASRRAHRLAQSWVATDNLLYVALICASPLLAILIGRIAVSGSALARVPWSELAGGALLVVAGVTCLAGIRRSQVLVREVPPRPSMEQV